jgi:uncharacterized protein (UPF0335 family)
MDNDTRNLVRAADWYFDRIEDLEREVKTLRNDIQELTCGDVRYTQLGQEVERMRTAFRGIASCSTCEVCREVAKQYANQG